MASSPPVFGPGTGGFVDRQPTIVPVTPEEHGSWIEGVGAAIALQPAWQAIGSTYDHLSSPQNETFSPYQGDYLKDYGPYSSDFIGVSSRYEGDRIKSRIDRNIGYRGQVDNTLGFWGMMAAEVANPVNYLPMPGLMGSGVVKGLLKGAASGLALGAGEELLRMGVDPTATTEEAVDNVVYGSLFTGLLGGVVGRIGAKDMQQFTRGYADYQNNIDRALDVVRNPTLEPEPVTHSGAAFVARPTGASETGVKKAFGLEKQTLASFWGRLQAIPVRAVNDFADAVLGDFGTMSAKNAQGIRTQQSALLASDRWKGWASGFAEDLNNIYARYLGDGTAGPAVFGLNLRTTGSRLAETFGRTGRPDGKMSFSEFKDAIFRAHKRDEIDPNVGPFVREGVDRAREFYDRAMIDGVKTGAIASAEGSRRLMQRRVSMVRDRMRRFEELEAKPNPSHNDLMEMAYIGRLQERHIRELSRHLDRQLADDPDIGNILDELEERFHRQETADRDLRESLIASGARQRNAAQELRDAIERSIEERIAKDRAVLAELNRKFESEGLTDRQKAYRDDLETRVRNYDEEGVRGTERQQTVMEDINALLDEAQRAEGPPTEGQARAFLTDRQLRLLDDLEERLTKESDYVGPENEKFYLPRLWDLDKVVADENGDQRLRGILTNWFTENPLPGASINPEAIQRRVTDALKSILKEAQTGDIQVQPTGFKSVTSARRINIPNELVMDFIDTDIENVTRNYGTRFGAGTEMARLFGTVDAEDAIDDVLLQSIREMQVSDVESGLGQITGLKTDLEWARDKMTGAVYSNDPAMMNKRRMVGGVKGWGTVTTLGKVALSSIPELGRAAMVLGFRRTFSHALDILNQPHELSRYLREITNEGMDTVTTGGVDRFVEHGGPTGAVTGLVGKSADKMQKFAHGPFMLATALPMLTDLTKRMNLSFINHFLMEDIHKVAAGEATVKEVARLASYGLSAEDAVKITTMPIERQGKFFLPNTGGWSDEMLAIRYMGAVNGLSKRIVPTAGLADIPELVKGFVAKREYPLITMPFQFMNYGFAAANKVLLSSLQGRDQSAMYGAALMIGLGYLTAKAKTTDGQWQNTPAEERVVLAVDQSGLTAIYSNGASMVEAATMGRVGVRPMLGMDPFMRDQSAYGAATQLGGVATSKIGQIAGLFIGDDPEAKEISSVVRRSIPMNNLFYWDSLWKDVEKSMLGWGEEDTPPPPPPNI